MGFVQMIVMGIAGLIGVILAAFFKLIIKALTWIIAEVLLEPAYKILTYVPHPDTILTKPTNEPWPTLYESYMQHMLPAAFAILIVAYIARMAASATSLPYGDDEQHLKRSIWQGAALLAVSWVALAGFLNIMFEITYWLGPEPDKLSDALMAMIDSSEQQYTSKEGGNVKSATGGVDPNKKSGDSDLVMGFLAPLFLGLILWFIATSVYIFALIVHLARIFGIYMAVWATPLLIALDYGQIPYIKGHARKFQTYLPAMAFMTVPQAIGFGVTFEVFGPTGGMQVDILPFSELLAPLYVFIPALIGMCIPLVIFMQSPAADILSLIDVSQAGQQLADKIGKPIVREAKEGIANAKDSMKRNSIDKRKNLRRQSQAQQRRGGGGSSQGRGQGRQAGSGRRPPGSGRGSDDK